MKKSIFILAIITIFYSLCYSQNIVFVPKVDIVKVLSGCTPPVVHFKVFSGKDSDTIKVYSGFNTGVYCQVNTYKMVGFICNKKGENDIYELYSHLEPKSSNQPKYIPFDTDYYEMIMFYDYDLKLKVKRNGIYVDSLSQKFHAQASGIGIENSLESIPFDCKIVSVYPNPFNPSTKIEYEIAKQSFVNISIFNSLGELVEVLEENEKYPGKYELKWSAIHNASGIYFIVLTTQDKLMTKKVMLLK